MRWLVVMVGCIEREKFERRMRVIQTKERVIYAYLGGWRKWQRTS